LKEAEAIDKKTNPKKSVQPIRKINL